MTEKRVVLSNRRCSSYTKHNKDGGKIFRLHSDLTVRFLYDWWIYLKEQKTLCTRVKKGHAAWKGKSNCRLTSQKLFHHTVENYPSLSKWSFISLRQDKNADRSSILALSETEEGRNYTMRSFRVSVDHCTSWPGSYSCVSSLIGRCRWLLPPLFTPRAHTNNHTLVVLKLPWKGNWDGGLICAVPIPQRVSIFVLQKWLRALQ